METKNLSSRQVRWAQELIKYHFQKEYCQSKANETADALSRFAQRSQTEENKLKLENTWILHKLQFLLTSTSFSGLSIGFDVNLSPLYQVFICGTYLLS